MSLIDCIRKVYFKLIKLLLEKGANINDQDKYGYTVLIWACIMNNNIEAIKLLIEKGADINIQDKNGYTPLMYACKYNHTEIIELLLDKGAIL